MAAQNTQHQLRHAAAWSNNVNHYTLALDIEAYERDQSKLTEIGWTIDNVNAPQISHHFVVQENVHLRNGRYVPDNKFGFNFGRTDTLPLYEILRRLREDICSRPLLAMVGHGIAHDIRYLQSVGFSFSPGTKFFDTNNLYREFSASMQSKHKLQTILVQLGIPHSGLHNAGNDAYYTMEAFLVMCARGY
ncbi:hypothetical protein H4R34_004707 [Dimargaris verticillata]|uniref:Gfd2/YDR514C-like C-terminal domain-containing protein n=1 Tax=Dimargaris verticillata TaxID=2761393 RepID=A0A9W8EBF3_9FUNG|nr:hypothetical protein H4R34_004707 [Dimargaris verticillata]